MVMLATSGLMYGWTDECTVIPWQHTSITGRRLFLPLVPPLVLLLMVGVDWEMRCALFPRILSYMVGGYYGDGRCGLGNAICLIPSDPVIRGGWILR
jgi:hypothetical protein